MTKAITHRELKSLVQQAYRLKQARFDRCKGSDNPQVIEARNIAKGAMDAYGAVMDALAGIRYPLYIEAAGPLDNGHKTEER